MLAHLTREKNRKPILAPEKGAVEVVHTQHEGQFVEAGEPLLTIKHYLTRKEVIELILQEALYLFSGSGAGQVLFLCPRWTRSSRFLASGRSRCTRAWSFSLCPA